MRLLVSRVSYGMKSFASPSFPRFGAALASLSETERAKLCTRDLLTPYTPPHAQPSTKSQPHDEATPMPVCPS